MKIEAMIQSPSMNFNFDSVNSTPFSSAPSSPRFFSREVYFSAPTSPLHSASLNRNISFVDEDEADQDFAFDFIEQQVNFSSTADQLFDHGRIRPLQPHKQNSVFPPKPRKLKQQEKTISTEEQQKEHSKETSVSNSKPSYYHFFTSWKLKDLILFRSSSEGRADEKDPLRKYTALNKKQQEGRNPSSFRSTDGSSSSIAPKRRRPLSAIELHYKSNKAGQDELKRKTYLPYTPGLVGWAKYNDNPIVNGLARSSTRR